MHQYALIISKLDKSSEKAKKYTLEIAKKLRIDLTPINLDIYIRGCSIQDYSYLDYLALNAKSIAYAKSLNLDILAKSPFDQFNLIRTQKELRDNKKLERRVNKKLEKIDLEYKEEVNIRYILDLVASKPYIDRLKESLKEKFYNTKFAVFYGSYTKACLHMDKKMPLKNSIDEIVKVLGINRVYFEREYGCYGANSEHRYNSLSNTLIANILLDAMDSGAEVLITTDNIFELKYKTNKKKITKIIKRDFHLPVVNIIELIATAIR